MSEEELNFWQEVEQLTQPVKSLDLEYRLHYNELGEIYLCTMTDHLENNNYLVVDKDTYENYFRYRVENRQLKKIEHDSGYRVQLHKADRGFSVVKNHAGLLLEQNEKYTDMEYYARNN